MKAVALWLGLFCAVAAYTGGEVAEVYYASGKYALAGGIRSLSNRCHNVAIILLIASGLADAIAAERGDRRFPQIPPRPPDEEITREVLDQMVARLPDPRGGARGELPPGAYRRAAEADRDARRPPHETLG